MGSSPIRVAIPYASVAQLVEQGTENPRVVGSIPTGGTISADLAHLVERHLAKVEVAGSSPVIRSKKSKGTRKECLFAFSGGCRGIHPPRTSARFCGFSPVHSCVVAYRLRPLGSADSHSVDIASVKKLINLFYLALPVIRSKRKTVPSWYGFSFGTQLTELLRTSAD